MAGKISQIIILVALPQNRLLTKVVIKSVEMTHASAEVGRNIKNAAGSRDMKIRDMQISCVKKLHQIYTLWNKFSSHGIKNNYGYKEDISNW